MTIWPSQIWDKGLDSSCSDAPSLGTPTQRPCISLICMVMGAVQVRTSCREQKSFDVAVKPLLLYREPPPQVQEKMKRQRLPWRSPALPPDRVLLFAHRLAICLCFHRQEILYLWPVHIPRSAASAADCRVPVYGDPLAIGSLPGPNAAAEMKRAASSSSEQPQLYTASGRDLRHSTQKVVTATHSIPHARKLASLVSRQLAALWEAQRFGQGMMHLESAAFSPPYGSLQMDGWQSDAVGCAQQSGGPRCGKFPYQTRLLPFVILLEEQQALLKAVQGLCLARGSLKYAAAEGQLQRPDLMVFVEGRVEPTPPPPGPGKEGKRKWRRAISRWRPTCSMRIVAWPCDQHDWQRVGASLLRLPYSLRRATGSGQGGGEADDDELVIPRS